MAGWSDLRSDNYCKTQWSCCSCAWPGWNRWGRRTGWGKCRSGRRQGISGASSLSAEASGSGCNSWKTSCHRINVRKCNGSSLCRSTYKCSSWSLVSGCWRRNSTGRHIIWQGVPKRKASSYILLWYRWSSGIYRLFHGKQNLPVYEEGSIISLRIWAYLRRCICRSCGIYGKATET